ncbi:hypothetical protein TIFTF001_022973 [Ficus carica]|uniref:ADP/ATP translocase n=1 Tax=Ficus carica TaxID=3494 RepID=A0AA88AKZ6_FICCA|nr:hypothetical protein TIFTF001_022973 [Ficus carica]
MAIMRSQQPSVYYDKIFGQPNRHSTNYGLNIGEYVNSGSLMQSTTLKRNVGQDVVSPPAVPGEIRAEKHSAVRRHSVDLMLMIVAGTMTAPIERVKLLIQNKNEMLKTGRLSQPYNGITHCFARTIEREGFL